jgi:hypothetical protein
VYFERAQHAARPVAGNANCGAHTSLSSVMQCVHGVSSSSIIFPSFSSFLFSPILPSFSPQLLDPPSPPPYITKISEKGLHASSGVSYYYSLKFSLGIRSSLGFRIRFRVGVRSRAQHNTHGSVTNIYTVTQLHETGHQNLGRQVFGSHKCASSSDSWVFNFTM